jgi:hypothetical protein
VSSGWFPNSIIVLAHKFYITAESQMWLGTCIELVNCGWIINSNRVLAQNLSVLIMAQLQEGTSRAPVIMAESPRLAGWC